MKKRTIAIILAGLLTLTTLSSCTSEPQSTSTQAPATTDSQATTQEQDESEGGTLIAEPLTISFLFPENAYAPITEDSLAIKEIERVTNVTLDFQLVPSSDYETKKNTYLATDSMTDVFRGSLTDVKNYVEDGLYLNLSEYEEYMPTYLGLLNEGTRAEDTKVLYYNDSLYSFARLEHFRVTVAPQPMIRTDLLEENGIATPTSWDELYDAFLVLKEAYPDSYALSSRNGTNYMIGQIAYSLGSGGFEGFNTTNGMYYEPNQDQYLYGPIQEEFKTVIEYLNNMYTDGLLHPDYAVMTRDLAWENLSSGTLFFYYDNNSFAARTFNPALQEVTEEAMFDMLDPMENSYGETRSLSYQKDWLDSDNIIVNSNVERPEDVVKFFDWLYTEEGMMISNFGVEGESYNIVDGEIIVSDELQEKHATTADVLSSIQAELGVGQFNFTPYIDETWFKQTTDALMVENGARIDTNIEAGTTVNMKNTMTLAFTEEENSELATLETNVMTVFNSEIDKFITGARPMSEYDDFIDELNAQGAQQIEDMYNEVFSRIQ